MFVWSLVRSARVDPVCSCEGETRLSTPLLTPIVGISDWWEQESRHPHKTAYLAQHQARKNHIKHVLERGSSISSLPTKRRYQTTWHGDKLYWLLTLTAEGPYRFDWRELGLNRRSQGILWPRYDRPTPRRCSNARPGGPWWRRFSTNSEERERRYAEGWRRRASTGSTQFSGDRFLGWRNAVGRREL